MATSTTATVGGITPSSSTDSLTSLPLAPPRRAANLAPPPILNLNQNWTANNPPLTLPAPPPVNAAPLPTFTFPPPPPQPPLNLCKNCLLSPRYHDGKKLHDYCGKACANQHLGRAPNPPLTKPTSPPAPSPRLSTLITRLFSSSSSSSSTSKTPKTPKTSKSASSSSSILTTSTRQCNYYGCSKNVYVSSAGVISNYCSIAHRDADAALAALAPVAPAAGPAPAALIAPMRPNARNTSDTQSSRRSRMVLAGGASTCIWCREDIDEGELFCGRNCISQVEKRAPLLIEIPKNHQKYSTVNDQFNKSWRHPTNRPQVKHVYKVIYSPDMMKLYTNYRAKIVAKNASSHFGTGGPGNEQRRWHGTKRSCTVGDNGNTKLCSAQQCSLCRIIRGSFDIKYYKNNTSYGRFGKGVYISSTSSKSNDYSVNVVTSPMKALLLNKVVLGRGEKLTQDSPNLTAPPTAGYDSVLGEVGGVLNYDECVVYSNDAIRPSYLVMYS